MTPENRTEEIGNNLWWWLMNNAYTGMTPGGFGGGFANQLQQAMSQIGGLNTANVANQRGREQFDLSKYLQMGEFGLKKEQQTFEQKLAEQVLQQKLAEIFSQAGINPMYAMQGQGGGIGGGGTMRGGLPANFWQFSPQQQALSRTNLLGATPNMQTPALQAQMQRQQSGEANALAQIQAQSQGALNLQTPKLASEERISMASLANALAQIQETGKSALNLQGPRLQSEQSINSANLANLLAQLGISGQNAMNLQGPQLGFLQEQLKASTALQNRGFDIKSELVKALSGLAGGRGYGGGGGYGGIGGSAGGGYLGQFAQLMGMNPPSYPSINMPQGPAILNQMPGQGTVRPPNMNFKFTGAGGQQFGGASGQWPNMQVNTGIGQNLPPIWNQSIASGAQGAMRNPGAPPSWMPQGMGTQWNQLLGGLGNQGYSTLARLGPYQQNRFNLGWQNQNAQYGNEFNRLMGGVFGTANDLDLTNRMNSLRWLTSMYS